MSDDSTTSAPTSSCGRRDARTPPRVAMVIGAGSVKCAAALGVQRVLDRNGIDVDLYVGCSAGSIYATSMALGWPAERAEETTAKLWTRELTSKSRRRAMLEAIRPRMFGFSAEWGLRDPAPVMAAIRTAFGDTSFDETETPLMIAATNFETGEQVVMSDGGVLDAIRASIAIPFVFPAGAKQ
jgi:NTE family protein